MKKPKCGECHGKSEAVPAEFPFCSECDFVASTSKQFQKHVLEHERVWWRATLESFFLWGEESSSTSAIDLYIPFFEEYLKIIGICRSCSFPKPSHCDSINTDVFLGYVSDLFPSDAMTSTRKTKPQPNIITNNVDVDTLVSLQSQMQVSVSKILSSDLFNPGSLFHAIQPGGLLHDPGGGQRAPDDPGGDQRA